MPDLDQPMTPATDAMPADERMVREFLARYRAPSGGDWTEAHVARMLQQTRSTAPGALRAVSRAQRPSR